MGQCGPEFSSMTPPSKPSSFCRRFFVSSSVGFRTYFSHFHQSSLRNHFSLVDEGFVAHDGRNAALRQKSFILKRFSIVYVKYTTVMKLLKMIHILVLYAQLLRDHVV